MHDTAYGDYGDRKAFLENLDTLIKQQVEKIKTEEEGDLVNGRKREAHLRKSQLEKETYIIPEFEVPKTLSVHEEEEGEEEMSEFDSEYNSSENLDDVRDDLDSMSMDEEEKRKLKMSK